MSFKVSLSTRLVQLTATSLLLLLCGCSILRPSRTSWAVACGDGRIDLLLDDFDSLWSVCCTAAPSIPRPSVRTVSGCKGNAMSIEYDLRNRGQDGQSWVVLERLFPSPRNLSNSTHIRLAIRGSNVNSHEIIELKLKNGSNGLFSTSLNSLTDLVVWRTIYIDLQEFTGNGLLDLTNITGLEIGIKRCDHCEVFDNPAIGSPDEHVGMLFVDEFAAVDLKPGAPNRIVETGFEKVEADPGVLASSANSILARVSLSGPGTFLIPAWFPEAHPNFNTYVQAEALLVFTYEYERTRNILFRDAARNLASKLISLQVPIGKSQAGAWETAYFIEGASLQPPDRFLPRGAPPRCDGNESMVSDPITSSSIANDIDSCEWVGNVGWVLIALARLQRSGIYEDPVRLQMALDRGASWVIQQPQLRGNTTNSRFPNLISLGIEGNISAYFGLLAAGKRKEAALLGDAIFQLGWDPVERRMRPGVGSADAATAMDVGGGWGVTFLISTGRSQEALYSQGFSASILRVSSFDGLIQGYGDISGPYTPVIESSMQAISSGIKDSNFVFRQLLVRQIPRNGIFPGAFPGGRDHFYGGSLNSWITTMAGVSPTAWVYFALHQNPLAELVDFVNPANGTEPGR